MGPKFGARVLMPIFGLMLATAGCAGSAHDNRRLAEDLERAQLRALESQLRVSELERRFAELEHATKLARAGTGAAETALVRELGELRDKLEVLISQNQVLLSRSEAEPDVVLEPVQEPEPPPAEDADPREQLLFWAQRVRADSTRWRGGLSPAQNEALNVLLRRERLLDPSNPWRSR